MRLSTCDLEGRPERVRRLCALGILILCCGGCASMERATIEDTEQMLSAAGFDVRPADTPAKQAQLAALPPYKLLMQEFRSGGNDTIGYVYADPDPCRCVYVGDQNAYQSYQRLALEKKLAAERSQAAEIDQNTAFDWGMWGPRFWGPETVIVVPRRK